MARNLQNCYCTFEAAERAAERRTALDGKPRRIWANELGYWEPLTEEEIDSKKVSDD